MFFLLLIIIIFPNNEEYKAINLQEFERKMTELNYILNPKKAKIEQMTNVESLTFAISRDLKTQIEYISFNSNESAKEFFDNMKIVFQEIEEADNQEEYKEINLGNYNKFYIKSPKKYFVVISLDDTSIYAITELDNISNLEKELKKIGY